MMVGFRLVDLCKTSKDLQRPPKFMRLILYVRDTFQKATEYGRVVGYERGE